MYKMTYQLKKLPFEYDALAPYMTEEILKIHHGKHHQGYVNNFNNALENYSEIKDKTPEELLKNLDSVPNEIKQAIINNGGGVYNHEFFWNILKKDVEIIGEIKDAIIKKFESFEKFKDEFSNAAKTQFGSGWAWLVLNNNELEIIKTSNQESPISKGMIPLLTIDVWEHAYYMKYQNRRPDYANDFFSIVNWEKVNKLFLEAKL